MNRGTRLPLALILSLVTFVQSNARGAEEFDKEGLEFYEKRIRPLLVDRCYKCHSEKSEKLEADLYVDSREGLIKGGDQGPAIEPGEPEKSLLIQAVKYEMDDLKMPPDRKLDDEQIADLEKWIKMGAPAPAKAGSKSAAPRDSSIETTRDQWQFQKPVSPKLPEVKQSAWSHTPIDRFVLRKLEDRQLQPATDAEKRVLVRRLTYDLLGLPPTPEQIEEFVNDERPDALSRLVDRLLASPHYGERWGRHWMDVVRYADTAGDNSDYPIPQIYKYRNWIIRAWNEDLPYDEFIRQQLAGDLLPSKSTEDRYNQIIATGYLANARRFGSRVSDYPQHLTIEDTIDNLGRTFLGLTINCARCHDHKFDPITNEDYYGLYGFFHSTRYPWPGIELDKKQRDFVPLASAETVAAEAQERAKRERELSNKVKELERAKKEADRAVGDASKSVEAAKSAATSTSTDNKESTDNKQLTERLEKAMQRADAAAKKLQQAKKELETCKQSPVNYDTAYAVAEGKTIEDVCVQIKGDPARTGEKVRRRFPTVLGGQTLPETDSSSGRLALANWLTDAANPLTARVLVNRLWTYHFGRGIVATPSDFGKQGRPPTHPELLDYLANQFTEGGWSIKSMQRRIVLSHIYQTASHQAHAAGSPAGSQDPNVIDPANELLWHFPRRRLDAESIRDGILAVSDQLDRSPGGAHPFPKQTEWDFTQHKPFRAVYETNRRSVYLMTQRIQRHPYLAIFDGPDTSASTAMRLASTTTLQALYLLNDEFIHTQAQHLANRLLRERSDDHERVKLAFVLLLGREPIEAESTAALAHLEEIKNGKSGEISSDPDEPSRRAWTSLARTMLRLNEFVYLD